MSEARAAALALTIDLGALVRNYARCVRLAAPTECAAVVKADAYGIGIDAAVPALAAAGCRTFFVALPEEGLRARRYAPDAAIYVLDGFFPDWAPAFADATLRPVLSTLGAVEAWAGACPGKLSALQVDTGMNRLGLSATDAGTLARRPDMLQRAGVSLLVSHLACADEQAHPQNRAQLDCFRTLRALFPPLPASLANSAGLHLGPDYHFDLARPGIALYGGSFSDGHPQLETVVTAEARVIQIRDAGPGDAVGYGAALHLTRPTRIAVLAAGYADGYLRAAGSRDGRSGASAWACGRRLPVLGRVSMDLIAIDVTECPDVGEGDAVELFGPHMPIDDVARAAGTIGYELLTGLSRRAERRIVPAAGSR